MFIKYGEAVSFAIIVMRRASGLIVAKAYRDFDDKISKVIKSLIHKNPQSVCLAQQQLFK